MSCHSSKALCTQACSRMPSQQSTVVDQYAESAAGHALGGCMRSVAASLIFNDFATFDGMTSMATIVARCQDRQTQLTILRRMLVLHSSLSATASGGDL
jgi:hypothetical protein